MESKVSAKAALHCLGLALGKLDDDDSDISEMSFSPKKAGGPQGFKEE